MSRIPRRFWILATSLVLLNAVGLLWIRAELKAGQRRVQIVAASPARDVDATDRFALTFDEPLVDARNLGEPLTRAAFTVMPALAGRWTWAAPERLEFQLDAPLPPGRVFTVRATSDAEAQLGRRLGGQTEFQFKTRALELRSCDLASVDKNDATFEVVFNQPVNPVDLLRLMLVTDADSQHKLAATILTTEPAERLVIRTARPRQDEVRLTLDPTLTGHNAELPLGSTVVRRLKIIPAFAILRAMVAQLALERDVEVTLHFTQELNREQSVPPVEVKPPVDGLRTRLEAGRLLLAGQFESNKRYSATVAGTLLSKSGETLGDSQTVSFEIADRQPAVHFPVCEGILSPEGNAAIEVQAVNIGGLRVEVARLHANNLVAALHRDHDPDPEQTHRQLPEKTLPLALPRNTPTKMLLGLRELVDQPCGVFQVAASATDQEWTSDTAIVMLTDLGLTVKQEREGLLAWVTSLRTAEPVAGVTVAALSQNNQTLGHGVTDAVGLVHLNIPGKHPDGPVWLVTAERDGDMSFLRPEQRPWVLDDVDQSGRPAPTTYDVLLYAERGVCRPGDTVHLTGIIRDAAGQVPPAFPLVVRVTRPDGRKVAELPAAREATQQGIFHCDFPTREDGQLGRYGFAVTLPGSHEALGETKLLVEEFVPVRIAVTAQATQPRFAPDETPAIGVHARYLFDQPATGLPLAVTGEFRRVPYKSPCFAQFTFGETEPKEPWKLPEIDEELDAEGRAEVELPAPEGKAGVWEGRVAATVTEPGGRSVSASAAMLVDTADRHIGLRLPAGRVVATDAGPVEVEWAFVTGEDKAASGTIEFALSRVEYDSVLKMVDKRPVWKSVEHLLPVSKQEVEAKETDDPQVLEFQVKDAGQYRLCATDRQSKTTTTVEFYASSNPEELQTIALNRPERLEIVLDKDAYVPGKTADVLIRSPFPGRLLLTLETDRVLDRQLVSLTGNTAHVRLPVPADLRGGAFVGATLVRGVDPAQDKWLPHRAIGLTRLMTDHRSQVLPVKIVAPASVRPGESVSVCVETELPRPVSLPTTGPADATTSQPAEEPLVGEPTSQPTMVASTQPAASQLLAEADAPTSQSAEAPAVVHLWAVDEGILRTTAYATPDPLKHFFEKRQLEVESADVFADLMPDYRRPSSMARIGGDAGDEEDESLQRSPVSIPRRAPAVVWRTSAPVGADGTLTIPLDLPKMTGEIRLMAVAVAGDCYGTTERPVTLATPLLVEAAWPRFAAPDDCFQVPVKLFNTSNEELTVELSLDTTGPLKLRWCENPSAGGMGLQPRIRRAQADRRTQHPRMAWTAPSKPVSASKGFSPGPASVAPVWLCMASPSTSLFRWCESASGGFSHQSPRESLPADPPPPSQFSSDQRIVLPPGKPQTVWLEAVATATGPVGVMVTATATTTAGEKLVETNEAAFPIRPIAPLATETKFLRFAAGEDSTLELPGEYLPGTGRVTLTVSSRPHVELLPALDQLMEYPYGCVEQTSSRLYALLGAPDLLDAAGEGPGRASLVRDMVNAGLLRLWSMQTRDGGLSYWPGGRQSELWPSAYVGQLLLAARRAGYTPDARFVEDLLKYLKVNLYATGRENEAAQSESENMRALLCHVLAGFGQAQEGWQARLAERPDRLDMAGRAHLAAAWLEAGQKERARAALPADTIELTVTSSTGSPTASQVHQQATLLAVLLDLDQKHPWIPVLVRKLEAARTAGCWGTTLENATALAALARYQLGDSEAASFKGEVVVGETQRFAFDDQKPMTARFESGAGPVKLSSSGTGSICVTAQTRGLAANGRLDPFDHQLQVRRLWTDRTGAAIDPAAVHVGDPVYVQITLAAPGMSNSDVIANVAIVDALPAGMEVEHPALATSANLPLQPGGDITPDRVEFRDDRVIIFTPAGSNQRSFRYVLRAVSAGKFVIPPIEASCMYNPALASRNGGGTLKVGR